MLSPRKLAVRNNSDRQALKRAEWLSKGAYFQEEDIRYLKFLVPEGARILQLGCGTGDLLNALKPSLGVGIDFSEGMIEQARTRFPHLTFVHRDIEDDTPYADIDGTFDFVLMIDTIGSLDDCQSTLAKVHAVCDRKTRLIVAYYNKLWDPLLSVAESLGLKMPQPEQSSLSPLDVQGLLELADFDAVGLERRVLIPARLFGLGRFINRFIAGLPLIRHFTLRHFVVARSLRRRDSSIRSASVIVPMRNERGNVAAAVERLPAFCDDIEIIFVEGHSKDGTLEEIKRVQEANPDKNIQVFVQDGVGKANAVFIGFDAARGDVLMILDGDLTMPPEDLPKFWDVITSGKGEFVNGSRLVYPVPGQAMQFLNFIANRIFSLLFSWLLSARYTDTLCGTKVILRSDYARLKENKKYFGDFDPFGDFDLIFGAAKLGLKTTEIPIRYASRTYGTTQISRFTHGVLLLRMVVFAFFRIKAL